MSRELQPIELLAVDVNDLPSARKPLNRLAEQGYAPLIGTYVPTMKTDARGRPIPGGMIVYVLGDVSQVGAAVETPETDTEAEVPAAVGDDAPDRPTAEVTVSMTPPPPFQNNGNGNGNGTHPPESHEAIPEGA